MMKQCVVIFLLLLCTQAKAQDWAFDDYSVAVIHKKAPINYQSHPYGKHFKQVLTYAYQHSDVNFAGHYVVITWGCGASCQRGAMVDGLTGRIYSLDIPMQTDKPLMACELPNGEDDSDNYLIQANSRLFINQNCAFAVSQTGTHQQIKTTKIYLWQEKSKTFTLLDEQITTMPIKR